MRIELTRRDMITSAAVGLAGMGGCALTDKRGAVSEKKDSPGWIDAHVHVWTDDFGKYPLAPGFKKEHMKPATFTPEELFAHCEPAGVKRINLIQMSFYGFDNSYMLDMMAKYPGRFAGTAVIDENAPDVAETMKRMAGQDVRAFRIDSVLGKKEPATWLRPTGFATMFKVGADLNQAMSCLIDTDALPELDRMCKAYPRTPVIIDHLCRIGVTGKIEQSQVDALCRMSRHERVMVKVGAFYALGQKQAPYDDLLPMIKQVVSAFGPERCMWESDSPFEVVRGNYESSVALIRDRCDFLTRRDKEQILRTTAEKFFF